MLKIETNPDNGQLSFSLNGPQDQNIEEAILLLCLVRASMKDTPAFAESFVDAVAGWAIDPDEMDKVMLGTDDIKFIPMDTENHQARNPGRSSADIIKFTSLAD